MPVADADFDYGWYISVLVDLTYVSPAQIGIGTAIRDQLLDVAIRVTDPDLRQRTVTLMARLLGDENVLEMAVNDDDKGAEELEGGGEEEVLWAAAWICGEFCRCVDDSFTCALCIEVTDTPHGIENSRSRKICSLSYLNQKMFAFFPNAHNPHTSNAPSSYLATGQQNFHHSGMILTRRLLLKY